MSERALDHELRIGFVNNMADKAMPAAERQFSALLAAAPGPPCRLVFFALSGVPRCAAAQDAMRGRYRPIESLGEAGLDAVIVTGAEPRAPRLEDEPYWPELARAIDWIEARRLPAIFSCLAAQAAVLRLTGVRRRPLAVKASGVYACAPVAGHPLIDAYPRRGYSPHSRWNDLAEKDLVDAGYRILTRAEAVGVDSFVAPHRAHLYLQGHPEYGAGALLREYRRDFARFLRGEAAEPIPPENCLSRVRSKALAALAAAARTGADPAALAGLDSLLGRLRPRRQWRASATALIGAWVAEVVRHADTWGEEAELSLETVHG